MNEDTSPQNTDFARQYGTNWTLTNVNTMYEWINIAAFNIRCLELSIHNYRKFIRNQTIIGLIFSTLSGTISVSQYNYNSSSGTKSTQEFILQIFFTFFSFAIAISAGALKIYQIQERLETSIKVKQDWIVFSTAITSELQLPIELRRDALFMIKKHKDVYLDLIKAEVELSERVKRRAIQDLPTSSNQAFDMINLPNIMINICNQEVADMKSANARNKDRFSHVLPYQSVMYGQSSSYKPASSQSLSQTQTHASSIFPNEIRLNMQPQAQETPQISNILRSARKTYPNEQETPQFADTQSLTVLKENP